MQPPVGLPGLGPWGPGISGEVMDPGGRWSCWCFFWPSLSWDIGYKLKVTGVGLRTGGSLEKPLQLCLRV